MKGELIIAVRFTGRKVVKARPLSGVDDLPEPIIGKGYFCCHLATSMVESFYPLDNGGWCVKTLNSTYHFFKGTIDDVDKLVAEFALVGPAQSNPPSLSFYWREKKEHLACGTPWDEGEVN